MTRTDDSARNGREPIWSSSALSLYGIFALTGVGTVLLGATLPVMLVQWRLTDERAGVLFLLLFLSSSSGSLVPRENSARVIASASALLAGVCVLLGFTHGWAVFPLTAAFGFGLGFSISTVTRVRLQCPPAQRITEVNRLNFIWGLGAFLCPGIANELIRHAGVRGLFLVLAMVFAIASGCVAIIRDQSQAALAGPAEAMPQVRLPWLAAAVGFLSVGMESALGAWLATYAHRLASGFAAPVEATTLFWLGLLSSRALCSTRLIRRFTERRLLAGFIALTAVGCAMLPVFVRRDAVLADSLLLGFGLGPMFPILLAAVLPKVRGNLVFVIAGVGASVFPWLTGTLSERFGSLRLGLLAPVTAGVFLLAITPAMTGALRRLSEAE